MWAVARARCLSSADAEDVFQVRFLRLVTHIDTVPEPLRVAAPLATTARFECLTVLRRRGRAVPSCHNEVLDAPTRCSHPANSRLLADERTPSSTPPCPAVRALPTAVGPVLMADPEPSYEEVRRALEMPIGSIGPTRGRCLKHLQRELEVSDVNVEPLMCEVIRAR